MDSRLFAGVVVPQLMGIHFRGFFCNDESIQYAYKEDTVTPTVLFLYVFVVMIVAVVATETYRARITEGSPPRYKLGSANIHATIVQVIIYIGYSQIGFMCVFVLTNLTKRCVGRLRPHFLDVCKPLNITCNGHEYYDKYVCSGNPDMVTEARKSFFSGHSSFAMYASTFAAVYLLARMPRHTLGRAVLPVIQTSLLAIGLLISYSRINDNKHHWSDVIAGILVGMVAAICTCVMWGRMFTKPSDEGATDMPTKHRVRKWKRSNICRYRPRIKAIHRH
ncbi:PAP2 family protein [Cooperia oncophora]